MLNLLKFFQTKCSTQRLNEIWKKRFKFKFKIFYENKNKHTLIQCQRGSINDQTHVNNLAKFKLRKMYSATLGRIKMKETFAHQKILSAQFQSFSFLITSVKTNRIPFEL